MTVSELHDLELSDLLAKPFAKNGNGPEYWNCWNLCREVYRRAGKYLPLYSEWIEDLAQRNDFIRTARKNDFVCIEKPEFLAVVTLRMYRRHPNFINHMGVMLDKRHFINIRKNSGVSIEDIYSRRWKNRVEGYYRYEK